MPCLSFRQGIFRCADCLPLLCPPAQGFATFQQSSDPWHSDCTLVRWGRPPSPKTCAMARRWKEPMASNVTKTLAATALLMLAGVAAALAQEPAAAGAAADATAAAAA